MGAPSKELWGMLIICVPIVVWQAWLFVQANATNLYFISVFEVVFLGCGAYLVWRYGGIVEAVTRVLEVTRVWDRHELGTPEASGNTGELEFSSNESVLRSAICRHCGFHMTSNAKFCRHCGTPRD